MKKKLNIEAQRDGTLKDILECGFKEFVEVVYYENGKKRVKVFECIKQVKEQ